MSQFEAVVPVTAQGAIAALTAFWADAGCVVAQPINTEVGAGTLNPATVLRVLGPEPWRAAYVEPSVRPDDSRYGDNPNRMQAHTQFQVILKPDPGDAQELYLDSLAALGIDASVHDVRFVEDNWQSPAFGAWGLGWEVWLDGLEVTQFTYFQQSGGVTLDPVSVEITYGLERLLMAVQGADHFKDITVCEGVDYTITHLQAEQEFSRYYLEAADIDVHRRLYGTYAEQAERLAELRLPLPAHQYLLKCSQSFNVLDARGAVGTTERARSFAQMRSLARQISLLWIERREELGNPLVGGADAGAGNADSEEAPAEPPALSGSQAPEHLLVELGFEELPHGEVASLEAQLPSAVEALLDDKGIDHGVVRAFATPRRVAVVVDDVAPQTRTRSQLVRGPRKEIAFDDAGQPTKAAEGFARSLGVAVDELELVTDKSGATVLQGTRVEASQQAASVIGQGLEGVVSSLRSERSMRWGAGPDHAMSRPLRWIVALLGSEVLGFESAGAASGRTTRGIRPLGSPEIAVADAAAYADTLTEAGIVASTSERRDRILADARALAAEAGAVVDEQPQAELIDEIVNLIESPTVILGTFSPDFLRIPSRVLQTVMAKHQRYLPLLDSSGNLVPAFVVVANGPVDVDEVRAGNERVLNARFADAAFFFDRDLQTPLADFRPALASLTFEDRLGSMLDRSDRIRALASQIASRLGLSAEQKAEIDRAAFLCKADLATELVTELTSLAGFVGELYAERSGEPPAVARAVFEASLPARAGDRLPQSVSGAVVSIAVRVDMLAGLFAVGLQPTGSADPFAMRRAATGLVQVILEASLDLDLHWLLTTAAGLQPVPVDEEATERALEFTTDKLEQLLAGAGFSVDTARSVSPAYGQPKRAFALAAELQAKLDEPGFHEAVRVLLRCVNLAEPGELRADLLVEPAETALAAVLADDAVVPGDAADDAVVPGDAAGDAADGTAPASSFEEFEARMTPAVDAIDRFFDEVLVMDDDPAVRANRKALLARVAAVGDGLADWETLRRLLPSDLGDA